MNPIELLTRAIESEILLGPKTFKNLSLDDVFAERYSARFEDDWNVLYDALQSSNLRGEDEDCLTRLRETAYVTTYDRCLDPELCGQVSDDFGLIGRASILLPNSESAASLLLSYMSDTIPRTAIVGSGESLHAIIEMLALRVRG